MSFKSKNHTTEIIRPHRETNCEQIDCNERSEVGDILQ